MLSLTKLFMSHEYARVEKKDYQQTRFGLQNKFSFAQVNGGIIISQCALRRILYDIIKM